MELLVVLVIISLLSGILVSAVMVARRKGGETKTKALILRLQTAILSYENSFGDYPPGGGGTASSEMLRMCLTSRKWTGRQEFDRDELGDTDANKRKEITDHWGWPVSYYHHRSYNGPPKELSFRLISRGADGEEGTKDDITNYKR